MTFLQNKYNIILLFLLPMQIACQTSSIIDNAIKKQGAAKYYFEQMNYKNARKCCIEAKELWMVVKNSSYKSYPDWAIDNNIAQCENLLELIPTSEFITAPVVVPIRISNNQILVDVILNQKVNATLILDTGATLSVLTPEITDILEISPKKDAVLHTVNLVGGKTVDVPFVSLEEIKIGKAVVRNLNVGICPVSPNKPFVGGLLGADFLTHYNVTIDHTNNRLILKQ